MSSGPKLFVTLVILALAVFMRDAALRAQEDQPRQPYRTGLFHYVKESSDPPVFQYRCSRGHFGERISDSDIGEILIWKDGTIAWSVFPEEGRWADRWYKSTAPAEKIEAAVKEIAEDFIKYPSQKRRRSTGVFFRLDASFSPTVKVCSFRHYESSWMDNILWTFYQKNREVLRSDDKEAIIKTIKNVGGFPPGKIEADGTYTGIHPAWMFDYKGLVNYYERQQSQGEKAETRKTDCTDEEILRAVSFYVADAEHLLVMEKKILDLLPSRDGLEGKELKTVSHYFRVDREFKEGKNEFFYVPISEKEANRDRAKIMNKTNEKRSEKK